MSSSISFTCTLYTSARAEPLGRQKLRAEDPRALDVATPTKWHEHVVLEGDIRDEEAVLCGPLNAGSPCEVRQAFGPSPDPSEQAFEPCPSSVRLLSLFLNHPTNHSLTI